MRQNVTGNLIALRAYVLNELENCLTVLAIDAKDGTLSRAANKVPY